MKKRARTATLLVLAALSFGCAHTTLTSATFFQEGEFSIAHGTTAAAPNHLVLQIIRHADEILNGPDIDEDQRFILELRNVRLHEKIPIPSADAVPQILVTRFGSPSEGKEFLGWVMIKKVTPQQVQASLHLDVSAQTADGKYSQKLRYRGDFTFYRGSQRAD